MRWHCLPGKALAWRELDGEIVVRNERTGSTHLVGAHAAQVLRALMAARGGLELDELAGHIQGERAAVEDVLLDFERLGLAERAA